MSLCYNSPESHPFVSKKERDYLRSEIRQAKRGCERSVPWKHMITSVPVCALVISQVQLANLLHNTKTSKSSCNENIQVSFVGGQWLFVCDGFRAFAEVHEGSFGIYGSWNWSVHIIGELIHVDCNNCIWFSLWLFDSTAPFDDSAGPKILYCFMLVANCRYLKLYE